MAFSKIILNGTTLMDVTNLTAGAGQVLSGYTSIDNAGEGVNGSVGTGTVTAPASITGTGATVSAGTNTLTLSKTISVTPNVTTAGYISSGTAGNSNVSLTASVNTRSSSDLTASGATVTAPAGYYASQATKTVSSGTEGTPTATKGTVSNHSVSVTPSVTNTAGYISGSTKTGTAVTVSASELVSGSETKTANGTYDVTNLASLVVNVSGGGIGTLLKTESIGSVSTSSTTATDLSHNFTVTGVYAYDLLIFESSVNTVVNGRHLGTVRLAYLTASSAVAKKDGATLATAVWNAKASSNGTVTTRSSTTARGIYPYSVTMSASDNGTATIVMYRCYNSTQTGTINGSYTTRVYGVKLYDLIGG